MRSSFFPVLALLALCIPAFGLVPQPTSVSLSTGRLPLTRGARIVYDTRTTPRAIENSLQPAAQVLAEELELATGIKPATVKLEKGQIPRPGDIFLQFDNSGKFAASEDEEIQSYTLAVSDKVIIRSAYTKGISYGTTTFLHSLFERDGVFSLPKMVINDAPKSEYRGLMVDLARQPSSIAMVKETVRLARQFKIRYLHLHFTDDQNFTFPFKPVTDKLEKNFTYTREELVELAAYADARGVTIIPELDLPGHSSGLRASGYLSPSKNDADVAHPDNYAKIEAIIDDMLSVFSSSPYFHIGGDESAAGNALVPFIGAINKYLRAKPEGQKRRLLVWEGFHGAPDEIPAKGDDRVIVMAWESSYNAPWDLLESGYEIINCSWKPLYVVGSGATSRGAHTRQIMFSPEIIHSWDKNIFMHWDRARPVYQDVGPGDKIKGDGMWDARGIRKEAGIIGGQMLSWEQNEKTIVRDLIARLPVMADRLWNPIEKEDYAAFTKRLATVRERALTIIHPVEILPLGPVPEPPYAADYRFYNGDEVEITLRNRTRISGTIRYEIGKSNNQFDGLNFEFVPPVTASSTEYREPFTQAGAFGIRAQLFRADGTPVDGNDWQHYNNWPNVVEVTEFKVPRDQMKEVPDFEAYKKDQIKEIYYQPIIRGPYTQDYVKGQMFRATLKSPGKGDFLFKLLVNNGLASVYVDLNRNGKWEPDERLFSNVGDDIPQEKTVPLTEGNYALRIDHAGGFIAPTLVLRIEGPGTDGMKDVSHFLAPPSAGSSR